MHILIAIAIPFFIASMLVEFWMTRKRQRGAYETKDAAASLSMGIGYLMINAAWKGVAFSFYMLIYQFRVFELGEGLAVLALALLADDFVYYWHHRFSHEVRLFWAAHVNHHSSQHYNLSTALRQSWTGPFTSMAFYWVLPLLGIHPLMMVTASSINLLYQYWIHTEQIGKLGAFGWVFNTPSHHRVHHGANVEYLDRNYAGILIIWDRMFGSFEPERAKVNYGLTKNIHTFNPLRIAFHEWAAMLRDAWRADSWHARLSYIFQPPGWSPDGSSQTARQMRAAQETGAGLAPSPIA